MTADEITAKSGAPPAVHVVAPDEVPDNHVRAVLEGAVAAEADVAVLELTGSGAVSCLQGLLTNDVEAPGPVGFVYGAVLTPKGMIVCDLWVARQDATLSLLAPAVGRAPLLDVFNRFVPPRLARVIDRSADFTVIRVVGPQTRDRFTRHGIAVPKPGRCSPIEIAGVHCECARPPHDQPFAVQLAAARADRESILQGLRAMGIEVSAPPSLDVARVLAGWPRLGAEIDHKTLPQEVRYDEVDGVSYSKGCYTGQETVARLHFRGHANRYLTGLRWHDDSPDVAQPAILRDLKQVGRVTSVVWIPSAAVFVGLGIIRREIGEAQVVDAAGAPAETVELPHAIQE